MGTAAALLCLGASVPREQQSSALERRGKRGQHLALNREADGGAVEGVFSAYNRYNW